mmetsp:Transcript_2983/g.6718  ORF Transcript_2983/g.6718 Transcript_2983/m.6718 type:complete len:199 (+) Transcript_2983:479-1075(+)
MLLLPWVPQAVAFFGRLALLPSITPQRRAEALALRGNAENQRGRFRAAASDFYRALREWPHHAEAWASLTQVDQIGLITSSGSLIFTAGLPFHSFIRFPNAFVSLAEFGVGLILTTRFERAWRPPWPLATGLEAKRVKMPPPQRWGWIGVPTRLASKGLWGPPEAKRPPWATLPAREAAATARAVRAAADLQCKAVAI